MKNRLINWFTALPYQLQVIIFQALLILDSLLLFPIKALLERIGVEREMNELKAPDYLRASVIIPLLETFIFQAFILRLLVKWLSPVTRHAHPISISVVAFLFGATHFYAISYIVYATLAGFTLNVAYVYYLPDRKKAFWTTAIIYIVNNSLAWLIS